MASGPEVKANAGIYSFSWEHEQVNIIIDRLHETATRLTAEVDVSTTLPGVDGHLAHADISLASTAGKQGLVKILEQRLPGLEWYVLVEQACLTTIRLHRQGAPAVLLGSLPDQPTTWLLEPLIQEGQANIIYGRGGSGKSYLADLCALLVQYGLSHVGLMSTEPKPVMILDYETSQDIANNRIKELSDGLGIEKPELLYRYSSQPLAYDIQEIQRLVLREHIGLLIVDSVGLACGGEPERAETVIAYFRALRSLRIATLSIDHVTKGEHEKVTTPFGSIYKLNLARNAWEVRASTESADDEILNIGLYHRKINQGKLRPAMGISFIFADGSIIVDDTEIRSDAELVKGLTLRARINQALKEGAKTVPELADFLEEKQAVVRNMLNRFKLKSYVKMGEKWGLISSPQ